MKQKLFFVFLLLCIISIDSFAQPKTTSAPPTADTSKAKKPAGITDKVKSSKKMEGLFTLYQDTATGSVQLFVKKDQLGKDFIYQSFSISGPTFFVFEPEYAQGHTRIYSKKSF